MEEIKTKGIVIKATDFSDSDKIITIFSSDLGLIKARIRGVKKMGAKLAFAAQPFALIEFMLAKKGDFYVVINATSIDQFFEITLDFDAYILMLAALEVIEKTVKENEPERELFLLTLKCFELVCYEKVSPMVVFIKFLLEALKFLGFFIEVQKCASCGSPLKSDKGFSFEHGGIICEKCQKNNPFLQLSEGEFAIFKNIDASAPGKLSSLIFASRDNLVSVISLLCKYFRIVTDEEIECVKKFL